MNDLINIKPSDLLEQAKDSAITTWSDKKKDEFVNTFNERVRVARFILLSTAEEIYSTALNKSFISKKHGKIIAEKYPTVIDRSHQYFEHNLRTNFSDFDDVKGGSHHRTHVGGRDLNSLRAIASERVEAILSGLPSLKKAVRIIDSATADKIDQIEKMEKEGQSLKEKFETLSEDIVMSELDQAMTIGAFQSMVKKRNSDRKKIFDRMTEIAKEGEELQKAVDKALYNGLPGLSESILAVIGNHIEQYIALDEMNRRVAEQVKFGDSDAAIELLRHFEKDEMKVSDEIKNAFKDSLSKMQLIADKKAPKKAKQLGK